VIAIDGIVERQRESEPTRMQEPDAGKAREIVAIARKAIEGKVEPQQGAPVTVERKGDVYVVTFTHVNPPGSLGPDFDARVTIRADNHEVIEIMGGP
jgi:hypothetical protein